MASYLDNGLIEYCSGCGACKEACPKQCINMKQGRDGFLFPSIDEDSCIHCDKCRRICPYNKTVVKNKVKECYSGFSANNSISENSSSGGLFYELAEQVIKNGGVVSGARFDKNYNCIHAVAHTMKELLPLMGSKYVQSDCSVVFAEIEKSLKDGVTVLFAGTPCQVAGLRNYLNREYKNLYCVDVSCHGVPSAADFLKCKKYLEKKHLGRLVHIKFRDKKRGGWYHSITYSVERNGTIKEYTAAPYQIPYYYFFLQSKNIRKCCYNCPYVGYERIGDITLADYWRAEKEYSEQEIGNGVSAILCNTEKGIRLLELCKSNCVLRKGTIKRITEANQPFIGHVAEYGDREHLLEEILDIGYKDTKTYIGEKAYLAAVLKAIVPEKIKRTIRRSLGDIKK